MQQLLGELLAYMADPDAPREPGTRLFERFGDECRRTLASAMDEAERLQHHYIGTEHQLLGIVRSTGAAAEMLTSLGVSGEKVSDAVEFIIGRGDRQVPRQSIRFTPRAKRVIELTVRQADELGQHEVGPEHLLLGLLREGEGIAASVLQSLGVSLEGLRSTVHTRLAGLEPWAGSLKPELMTVCAQHALEQALLAARWFYRHEIDTEHILLGLLRTHDCAAERALSSLGIDARRLQGAIETDPAAIQTKARVGYTLAARAAVERAHSEAAQRDQQHTGSGHLPLGLLAALDSRAVALLGQVGASTEAVRQAVEPLLAREEPT